MVRFPYYAVTSGHQVNVDLPNNSGSMQVLILFTKSVANLGCSYKLLKNRTQLFLQKTYKLALFDAKYSILTRVSIGVIRSAHRNILRSSTSARANTGVPPCSCIFAGPRQPKITLPYNKVVTAKAYTSYTRTRLLNNPNKRAWHFIMQNAASVFLILIFNISEGLFLALLIISPKYLNSSTFSRGYA